MNIILFGGSGTLGNEITKQLLQDETHEITVFSRDEQKQQKMRVIYPSVKYIIGDIRCIKSVGDAIKGKDIAYHVAAMKHIDVVENNVSQAISTNILGSINIAQKAIEHKVSKVVFSSTDKAVLPINVYGHTKAIIERYYLGENRKQEITKFHVYRWGNVLGSCGSVVHYFYNTLKAQNKVFITDINMTRFWILISDAVRFMLAGAGSEDEVLFPEMKACSVLRIAEATSRALSKNNYEVVITGIRDGEKIHECLESNHNYCIRSDTAEQYSDSEINHMIKTLGF